MSLDVLKNNGVSLTGILFIGKDNDHNEALICERYFARNLGNIPEVAVLNETFVTIYADELLNNWRKLNFMDLLES
jgi:hypothetical protein